jgi:multidrug efflux pump subunit AcrA (membrane-fusion protein)
LSKNQLEEAQVAVEQQEQAVQAAQARLKTVQAALNPSNAEVAIAQENIAQEKASGQSNLANLQREKEALIQQQIEIQQQQSRDRQELQQLEKDLYQTAIKATADGILFQLNLRNTGQRVVSGEEIAQIAPSNTPLLVKASVPAQNISQVKPGQLAQLRVSACPYPDYGIIQGVVNKISPDTINTTVASATTQTKIQPGKTALYQVTIEPESLTLGHGDNQCSLQLGMEGRVDIIANQETVLKFLLRKARLLTDL